MADLVMGVMTVFAVGVLTAHISHGCAEATYQTAAVERGYAEWTVDSSGNAEWRWIEPEELEAAR